MLVQRADIWVPPPSRRSLLRCGGVMAMLMAAAVLTHGAIPQPSDPAQPGACQRTSAPASGPAP